MSAELDARRTAAAAALADFERSAAAYLDDPSHGTPGPWAWRLAAELGSVLERLDEESPAAGRDVRRHLEELVSDAVERAWQDGLAAASATAPRTWPYRGEVVVAVGRVVDEWLGGGR